MILACLLLITGLVISGISAYFGVLGFTAIFASPVIFLMGGALEVAKLVGASWLKSNWLHAPRFIKYYMSLAVIVLMLINCVSSFGFLSRAHSERSLPSSDIMDQVSLIESKILTQQENVELFRKNLAQLNTAVDQTIARSTTERGATRAAQLRRSQAQERASIQKEIDLAQQTIATLKSERSLLTKDLRKFQAEVGPIKYITKLFYGDSPDVNILEKAVTWMMIVIVAVFDPLAVVMILAAQTTFIRLKSEKLKNKPIVNNSLQVQKTEITQSNAQVLPETAIPPETLMQTPDNVETQPETVIETALLPPTQVLTEPDRREPTSPLSPISDEFKPKDYLMVVYSQNQFNDLDLGSSTDSELEQFVSDIKSKKYSFGDYPPDQLREFASKIFRIREQVNHQAHTGA